MHGNNLRSRSHLAGSTAIALFTCAGALSLWLLVLEVHPPVLSRPALALQGLAVVLGLLLAYWSPPRRFFLYPLVLAGVIYLWDTTLPPPSLPDGPLRQLVPQVVLLGMLIDVVVRLKGRRRRPRRNATRIRGGYMELEGAARVLAIPPSDLRARLQLIGRITLVSKDGAEYLSLDDLMAVLAHWDEHAGGARSNGRVRHQL